MDTRISNIGQLVTPIGSSLSEGGSRYALQVTNDTELFVRNGRIVTESVNRASSSFQTIDAGGGVVLPGLIDPFWIMPHLPAWADELPESKLQTRDLGTWSLRLLRRALQSGVTAIEVKCRHDSEFEGLGALAHLQQQYQPRVIGTLLASLPENGADRDNTVSSLIAEVIPEIRQRRLATFCEISLGNNNEFVTAARTVLRAASGAGFRPKLHIESAPVPEDMTQLALSLEAVTVGCASHLSPAVASSLSQNQVLPVYLPGVRERQTDGYIDVRSLVDRGLPLAIGSGSGLHDCPQRSMWSVLASALERMELTLPEAITTCTLNNAIALEMSHEIGSLEHGKRADLILLDLVDYREIRTALCSPPVSLVMVNGEIVHSL